MKSKTVAFHTLGCKLNFSESSEIGRELEHNGFKRVSFGEAADVTVIHSCSVTGAADKKTKQAIKKAVNTSPNGFIVVMGCFVQLNPEEASAWDGVDLVLGNQDKFKLSEYLNNTSKKKVAEVHSCETDDLLSFFPAQSTSERTRSFLKIQDGCDYSCTYCTIPKARGKSRNPAIQLIVNQATELIRSGVNEMVLTGVNIGDFGRSTGDRFIDLIKALDRIPGDVRYRISSIEPNLIDQEIITFCKNSEHFTPHFHIPLQSGSDLILKQMQRRYLRSTFAARVLLIKEMMPDACIGADVIVGFPGEKDEDFKDAFDFIKNLPISYLHVFTYSERKGTPAENMKNQVPHRIRTERSKILHDLSDKKRMAFYSSQLGTERTAIFETAHDDGTMTGFTENYIEVEAASDPAMLKHMVKVKLLELKENKCLVKV